jgi:hypothetical protein
VILNTWLPPYVTLTAPEGVILPPVPADAVIVGLEEIYAVLAKELLPPALVAVRFTVYIPAFAYRCTGFWRVEFVVFPSPKFHSQDVGVFVEVSVKLTTSGKAPDVGVPVKPATGARGFAVI